MPKTRKLVDLFRAIGRSDFEMAREIADEVASEEAEKGHVGAARLLRGALNGTKPANRAAGAIPENQDFSLVSSALVQITHSGGLDDVILAKPARQELQLVAKEWKYRSLLTSRGIAPRSKILLHGPPGCGKSLTAKALGVELDLPTYMVRFDAVIGAFLGQTAMHLRQIFDFAERTPCVLLLDELDALGKRRGNPLDVGELDRIVISLMQELEHSHPKGLIVATSNLASHLDDALWRRFDLDIEFRPPTQSSLNSFARQIARKNGLKATSALILRAARQKSFAASEAIILNEVRRQIIDGDLT